MIKTYTLMTWIFLALPTASGAWAMTHDNSEVCDNSARFAAQKTGVPLPVLLAITRVETGRKADGKIAPWPWTVNMEGKGIWFASQSKALDYAQSHHTGGSRSFDIGCFQINYRWHGAAFDTISHMFDPNANALYAATFLKQLYLETQDWSRAAGAYHSRTPKYALKYRARFDRFFAQIPTQDQTAVTPAATSKNIPPTGALRPNRFPLLLANSAPSTLGSLVPADLAAAQPLFGG
ncbi:transglycosylase SLT domain-containing protein [Cognatishimia sp. WU-CL00825]|uniref:transglycosylase SLT domain-containing protein n=1 Tax=Cognatishimia sp. WU-CL00825 TaxID=3127658 RepID=UPI0033659935